MRKDNRNATSLEIKLKQARFKNKPISKKNTHKSGINVVKKRWKIVRISEEKLGSHFSEVKDSMSQLKTILGES